MTELHLPPGRWRAVLLAVGATAVLVMLLRAPLGEGGLGAIASSDGTPAAATAPYLAAAWLTAAALGSGFGGLRRDGDAEPQVPPVGMALGLLAPVLLLAAGIAAGPVGSLLFGVLGLEGAVLAGCLVGFASVRRPELRAVVVAAVVCLLLVLAARTAMILLTAPSVLVDLAGRPTEELLEYARAQRLWRPVAAGVGAAVACAIASRQVERPAWLVPVALAPLALHAAGVALGSIIAGTAALSMTMGYEWLGLATGGSAGCLLGAAARLAVGDRRRDEVAGGYW